MTTLTNADRAERVRQYVIDYAQQHDPSADLAIVATDFIADVLHLLNTNMESAADAYDRAYDTYLSEVEEAHQ
jgi:hypothetical protein